VEVGWWSDTPELSRRFGPGSCDRCDGASSPMNAARASDVGGMQVSLSASLKRRPLNNCWIMLFDNYWRKGWDSNPRWSCPHGGFQDRCLKPLGHPSFARSAAPRLRLRPGSRQPSTDRLTSRTIPHISPATPRIASATRGRPGVSQPESCLGDSLTVERWTLTPLVLVRIQVPQPSKPARPVKDSAGFLLPGTPPSKLATSRNTG
jgi:hypothetical protein